ncbi:MAG: nitrile hydratase subunit beta [Alsobacter sp.]
MNGAQDLGGMMGFGPVVPEQDEPLFHAPWERRALGLTIASAALGEWNIDLMRHARESIPPPRYLASSYYEIWITALADVLQAKGLVKADELGAGHALHPAPATRRQRLEASAVPAMLARGGPCDRPVERPARFAVGDRVRARNINPTGHTRLPRYVRGKLGVVERLAGGFVYPDSNAHLRGEDPQWVYTVRFEGPELWGDGSDPDVSVCADCWEPYLEAAA